MEDDKLVRLIAGQLGPEEKEKVLGWISESPEHREEYYKLKNLWALSVRFNTPLEPSDEDRRIFYKNLRLRKNKTLKTWVIRIARYAAIAVVAFILGKYIFVGTENISDAKLSFNEVIVPAGQVAEVKLPDGTDVFINSCSNLQYPSRFNLKERRIFLSGEAYFNVKSGSTPFYVESEKGTVQVYGTKFNVNAYPHESCFITTLKEGRVAILDSMGNYIAALAPGEQCVVDASKKSFSITSVNPNLYDSWKEGIYVFDHETLEGIARRLEMIFAVKITIENESIRNYKFTGTISRNVQFEQILKIIQLSAPVKYRLKEEHGAITEVTLY